jgi:4'-phosphopantetheinyl transferase
MVASSGGVSMRNPELFWLQQTLDEVPTDDDWLSANELARLRSFRLTKRHEDWRLGRWTAKSAVAGYLHWEWNRICEIEILSASCGAPEVHLPCGNSPAISISHRGGVAMCTVGPPGSVLGCDLELIEARSDAFVHDYFTAGEFALIQQMSPATRPLFANVIWSAKESALKALHEGLRVSTNLVEVDFTFFLGDFAEIDIENAARRNWQPIWVGYSSQQFIGWWCVNANVIYTVIGSWSRPVCLNCDLVRCS